MLLIIPAALFDSFASLKLMRLWYSWLTKEMLSSVLDTSSYVVPVFFFLEVEKIVVFLTDRESVVQRS